MKMNKRTQAQLTVEMAKIAIVLIIVLTIWVLWL